MCKALEHQPILIDYHKIEFTNVFSIWIWFCDNTIILLKIAKTQNNKNYITYLIKKLINAKTFSGKSIHNRDKPITFISYRYKFHLIMSNIHLSFDCAQFNLLIHSVLFEKWCVYRKCKKLMTAAWWVSEGQNGNSCLKDGLRNFLDWGTSITS